MLSIEILPLRNVAVTINEKESTVNGQNHPFDVEKCVLSRIVPASWRDYAIGGPLVFTISAPWRALSRPHSVVPCPPDPEPKGSFPLPRGDQQQPGNKRMQQVIGPAPIVHQIIINWHFSQQLPPSTIAALAAIGRIRAGPAEPWSGGIDEHLGAVISDRQFGQQFAGAR